MKIIKVQNVIHGNGSYFVSGKIVFIYTSNEPMRRISGTSFLKGITPVIITEEKGIELGNSIFLADEIILIDSEVNVLLANNGTSKKILALPEHISPAHLQAIVDGKLRNGESVLVECEFYETEDEIKKGYRVKFNADNVVFDIVKDEKNPYLLEVGKEYWFKYFPAKGRWYKAKITRFTTDGFPWMVADGVNGIVSPGSYEVSSTVPEEVKRGDAYIGQLENAISFFEEYPDAFLSFAKRQGLLTKEEVINILIKFDKHISQTPWSKRETYETWFNDIAK